MFCSWKTHPAAPCGCAFRLRRPVNEILEHLVQAGPSTLILRRPGLSVAMSTCFGHPVRGPSRNILRDAISGLETDLSQSQHAYLIREFPDQCPIIAIADDGKPAGLTVRLDGHEWNSPFVRGMIDRFEGSALDCIQSRRLGAGAWLDEWEPAKAPLPVAGGTLLHARRTLQESRLLAVEIQTASHHCETRFTPSFIDHEGTVIRISDRKQRHIVYADLSAAGFQLKQTGPGSAHLFHSV